MPDTLEAPDWQSLSPQERNLAFNNRAHVGADYATAKVAQWATQSEAFRRLHPDHLDIPYRAGDRTRWDLYPASDPRAPCWIHVHGGYWQRGSRESFAAMASGILAHGWSAALPGYTLAPDASLSQIVGELHDALDWLAANSTRHGIAGPLILTGWSAGGHLTATLLHHPAVVAGMSISGVFELAPLRDSPHVNDLLQLSEDEVQRWSPSRMTPVDKPLAIAYGTSELPAMIATSRDFHAVRAAAHCAGNLIPVPRANHFTVLDELQNPDSDLIRSILDLAP